MRNCDYLGFTKNDFDQINTGTKGLAIFAVVVPSKAKHRNVSRGLAGWSEVVSIIIERKVDNV